MMNSIWIRLLFVVPLLGGVAVGPALGQAETAPNPTTELAQSTPAAVTDRTASYYHFFRALDAMGRGVYSEANDEFRQAVDANPTDANLRVEFARFLIQTQNLAEANRQLETCLKDHPDHLEARRLLAGIYSASVGDGAPSEGSQEIAQKAIDQYEQILRLQPEDTDSLFALGRLYYRLRNTEKAEEYLRRFTSRAGGSLEGHYYLALIYAAQKKFEEALAAVDEMERLRPESMQIQLLKADILENLGRTPAAEAIYQRMITASPGDSAPHLQYARMLIKAKQLDRALAVLEQAREKSAADEEILTLIGQIQRDRHEYEKAIQAYKDAIALAPSMLEPRYELGVTYAQMGDALNAIPVFLALVRDTEKAPGDTPRQNPELRRMFLLNLGFLYMDTRRFASAMDVFLALRRDFPEDKDPLVYLQQSEVFRNLEQYERAMAVVEEGLRRIPDNQRLLNQRGLILVSNGQAEQAVQELEGRIGPDGSDDVAAYQGLAAVYAEMRRWEPALEVLDRALKKFENHPGLLFQKAATLEKNGQYPASEAVFQKLLEVDPENANALNYLGYMLIDYDLDLARGMALVQKAMVFEPKNPAFLDSLGWGHFKKKEYKKALEYLEQAVRVIPDDPTLLEHLGDVHRALGRPHEARDYYEKALPLSKDPVERTRLQDKIRKLKPKLQV